MTQTATGAVAVTLEVPPATAGSPSGSLPTTGAGLEFLVGLALVLVLLGGLLLYISHLRLECNRA